MKKEDDFFLNSHLTCSITNNNLIKGLGTCEMASIKIPGTTDHIRVCSSIGLIGSLIGYTWDAIFSLSLTYLIEGLNGNLFDQEE